MIYISELIRALAALDEAPYDGALIALSCALPFDATIYTCGNGGSAATADHLACDLLKATRAPGVAPIRAHSLCANSATLMAYANDEGYSNVFVRQLESLARPGDVLIAISGSGNSANVVDAAMWARKNGLLVICLTGMGGGRLAIASHHAIVVPSDSMPQIEDVHMALCHALTQDVAAWQLEMMKVAA